MNKFLCKFRTVRDLGFLNLVRVLLYRLHLRLGLNKAQKTKENMPAGLFFRTCKRQINSNLSISPNWRESGLLFSHLSIPLDDTPPDWSLNPLTGQKFRDWQSPWWRIPDFDKNIGDIKVIWELSRFEWVLAFSQLACTGDEKAVGKINDWLTDWCKHNPAFLGPNWKCGQEASIRVMHLAMAALILEQSAKPSGSLRRLILIHLERINPTTIYAIAQCNNHATSEAAALYIGGSLLGNQKGERFSRKGRELLEVQVKRLVSEDGSFSQYSLNYHRVLLDTLSMVEVWRKKTGDQEFSQTFYGRARVSSKWLRHMINLSSGDGPNLGANDGARLLPLTNSNYRDYRPTLQLAYSLFFNLRALVESGPWDDSLDWLKLRIPEGVADDLDHLHADQGGFAVLRREKVMAMLRYPKFSFRPSHADALHLDLWLDDINVLRDGGTYQYNTEKKWLNYFSGTESHNTIQFEGRDQMPRLSRFLFGDWLRTLSQEKIRYEEGMTCFGSGYVSRRGISHYRKISLSSSFLLVDDEIKGVQRKAELRWRLAPGEWELFHENDGVKTRSPSYPGFSLFVYADVRLVRCELKQGWESKHYLEKTPLTVLELEVESCCKFSTEVRWRN